MTLLLDVDRALLDKDAGVLAELRPYLLRHNLAPDDDELLCRFDEEEAKARSGRPLPYRKVLRQTMRGFGFVYQFPHTDVEIRALEQSVARWPIYPEVPDALRRLKAAHRLIALTSLDIDLFAPLAVRLGDPFAAVVTPADAGAYPPSIRYIKTVIDRAGEGATLVAGSRYELLAPARTAGLAAILVERTPLDAEGLPPIFADQTFPDLFTLCDYLGA
ncbi:MAG: hypothetical protein HQK87_11885 [Nitrospinae bacterium]|nr:hypothetical protein [Nitrospinota bacterium]